MGWRPLEATLRDWHDRVSAPGRAMLTGAAELEAYLGEPGLRYRRGEGQGREGAGGEG